MTVNTLLGYQKRSEAEELRAEGSWSGYQGLTVVLGIRNLFDEKPPYSNASSSIGQFQAGYDIPYVDVHDQFRYARLVYNFK